IAEESVRNTGYEEMSLLSLSTSDYPYLEELIAKLEELLGGRGVKLSLPSVRAQSFKGGGSGKVVKRAGLTFAPEAGTDNLRNSLCKGMTNEEIIQKSRLALGSGWKKVKLYFMIGLPGETDEDLGAIAGLASEIGRVSLSVSPFIPKPYSGFEAEAMNGLAELKEKIKYLRARFDSMRKMKIDFHNPETSLVEAVLSRGDRAVGKVIEKAWQKGARLQAWTEHFNYNLWVECFSECGVDPAVYLKKIEKPDMPWKFIK
ncbi:MAG: B12-binding domain-containing radical SAM protein, partial [Candidatus Omnitrophica bacterium]|nr:B12-binding domain-containing radical SAM protein [Candidatus Omnitrophota bacterium]